MPRRLVAVVDDVDAQGLSPGDVGYASERIDVDDGLVDRRRSSTLHPKLGFARGFTGEGGVCADARASPQRRHQLHGQDAAAKQHEFDTELET